MSLKSLDPLALLDDLISRALGAGADGADGVVVTSASLSVAQRLGESEGIERAESQDVGLRVFRGRRQAIVSSSDVSPDALGELVERALAGRFCHGDQVTMADVCLIPQVFNGQRFDCPLEAYPTIMAIFENCQALKPFADAHPESQADKF